MEFLSRRGALGIWRLDVARSEYDGPATVSRMVPALDVDLLARCISMPSWREARKALREALAK